VPEPHHACSSSKRIGTLFIASSCAVFPPDAKPQIGTAPS
jgi:hypothetical protein